MSSLAAKFECDDECREHDHGTKMKSSNKMLSSNKMFKKFVLYWYYCSRLLGDNNATTPSCRMSRELMQ
jgi:hypothetical protein